MVSLNLLNGPILSIGLIPFTALPLYNIMNPYQCLISPFQIHISNCSHPLH